MFTHYNIDTQKLISFADEPKGNAKGNVVELVTQRPSRYHLPVIENGQHTGEWFFADIQSALLDKKKEIAQKFKAAMSPITGIYTNEDIASFPTQEAEAKAWTEDNNAPTPFIDGLLANRPTVDKSELVNRILTNASNYKSFAGPIIGKKQYYEDQLYALIERHRNGDSVTIDEIKSIVVDFGD